MNWGTLIALAINNGLPVAIKLAEKWDQLDQPVKPEEIAELKALAAQTPITQMKDALARFGILQESEEGRALLRLVTIDPSVNVPPATTTAAPSGENAT